MDRFDAGIILFGQVAIARAVCSTVIAWVIIWTGDISENRSIWAKCSVIFTRHCITDRLAGDIFHAEPGLEQQGKVYDPEDEDQQDGQCQGKFQKGLGCALAGMGRAG
jgi:hypothetical protein